MKKTLSLLFVGLVATTALAQEEGRPEPPQFDKTKHIEMQTARFAERYGLSEEQASQLLTLNTEYADKLPQQGPRPGGPQGGPQQGPRPGGPQGCQNDSVKGCCPPPAPKDSVKSCCPPQGDVQPIPEGGPQGGPQQGCPEELKANIEAYESALKEILTEEQYAQYQADRQQRGPQGPGPR